MNARPKTTQQPQSEEDRPADYQTYTPQSSPDQELQAIQERLKATGRNYTWEMKDSITLDSTTYPVKWMYAVDEEGEWFDIVFSEDADLCYKLYENRNLFQELREKEIQAMNEKHPGRGDVEGNMNNWIIQDVFYHGYSFYADGHGLALLDAGMVGLIIEWNASCSKLSLRLIRRNKKAGQKKGVRRVHPQQVHDLKLEKREPLCYNPVVTVGSFSILEKGAYNGQKP